LGFDRREGNYMCEYAHDKGEQRLDEGGLVDQTAGFHREEMLGADVLGLAKLYTGGSAE
jgi:hypothetical protein